MENAAVSSVCHMFCPVSKAEESLAALVAQWTLQICPGEAREMMNSRDSFHLSHFITERNIAILFVQS